MRPRRFKTWNTFTRWILHTPVLRRLADRQVCELRFTGVRSGREIVLPVMYAQRDDQVVVLVGAPESKHWWRNFTQPHPVQLWLRGKARTGTGHVVARSAPSRPEAARIYTSKFPDLPALDDPMVVITLTPAG